MKARIANFGCVDANNWKLCLRGARRQRLIKSRSFESIVKALTRSAKLLSIRREQLKCQSGHYRVVMVLKVDRNALDLFHNGRCGYRAQYYLHSKIGERANAYVIRALWKQIKKLFHAPQRRRALGTG